MTHVRAFADAELLYPLWAVVHVYDPSYAEEGVCVCGLAEHHDHHAQPVRAVSELAVGRRRP